LSRTGFSEVTGVVLHSEHKTGHGDCRLCDALLTGPALKLGNLPPCNRFRSAPAPVATHPLTLVACESCGFIQLDDPMPPAMIVPRVPWLRYNEPDGHLDDLAARVIAHLGRTGGTALGFSPFEGPWHARLAASGFVTKAMALDGTSEPGLFPYLETWQTAIEAGTFAKSGTADIVSCRYILEHCHRPLIALQSLGRHLAPGGLLLVEVPDSAKFLAAGDYCFPWEEHVSYFVEESFVALCRQAGFAIVEMIRYPGLLEDALVAVLRPGAAVNAPARISPLFAGYRDTFAGLRGRVQAKITALAGPDRDCVALFGVGHQAIMFANAFGIAPLLAAVVDDDANKRGQVPPGFGVPVISSAALLADEAITTCLLAVSPRAEPKIRELLAPFVARGVAFPSIFAGVPGSILSEPA
jgi:SAM-dependent methyltransferase